jgi:uncharacterized membrane protein YbhN (UPF0104 family)
MAQLLLLAALVFVVLRVRSLWHGSHIELARVDWAALAAAVALAAAATLASGLIWLDILRSLGLQTERRWAGLFFQAQLGKYIPGSVWQYAGRAAAARAHGVPVRPVAMSLPIEVAGSAAAAGTMGAFLLGWWGATVVVSVAILLVVIGRLTQLRGPAVHAVVRATLLYLPTALALGGTFWLFARGLVDARPADFAVYTGAFAVAWLAGLVAIYAPGGLGVREAVLVALLSARIGAADALVLAAASRLALILVDVSFAGLGAVVARGGARLRPAGPP